MVGTILGLLAFLLAFTFSLVAAGATPQQPAAGTPAPPPLIKEGATVKLTDSTGSPVPPAVGASRGQTGRRSAPPGTIK